MLAIVGAPADQTTTVAYAAESLGLKHNSRVELANRCVGEGLLRRVADESDGRKILLKLTPLGSKMLRRLTRAHAKELNVLAPQLIKSLQAISTTRRATSR